MGMGKPDPELMLRCDRITDKIIGAAIEVHRTLGPGLPESTYEACLFHELMPLGISVRRQVEIPVHYKGKTIDCGYRLDLLVEDLIVIELKAVEKVLPIHEAQLLTYLRLANLPLGLILNFNVTQLTRGITRRINNVHA